jgi:hypothetical protein
MKRLIVVAALILALSTAAWPHGNMDHILGTVVKINGTTVSVENEGKTTEVQLQDTTTYESAGHAEKMVDLRVGDRVVIHAVKVDGKEVAHEVRFTHPAK